MMVIQCVKMQFYARISEFAAFILNNHENKFVKCVRSVQKPVRKRKKKDHKGGLQKTKGLWARFG